MTDLGYLKLNPKTQPRSGIISVILYPIFIHTLSTTSHKNIILSTDILGICIKDCNIGQAPKDNLEKYELVLAASA